MRHLVTDVSQVLTLLLASWQAWPKTRGEFRCLGGRLSSKRPLDKTLQGKCAITKTTDVLAARL